MQKTKLVYLLYISFLATFCYSHASVAQNKKFEHLTVGNGLSNPVVLCAYQDSRGFLWFCTQDGLNQYDGYDFTVYRHDADDPYSISSSYILDIAEDAEGKLWITTNYGLNQFDPKTQRFTHYYHDPKDSNSLSENNLQTVFIDSQQQFWISTISQGVTRYNPRTQKFTHYQHDPENANSIASNTFYGPNNIYEDSQGYLWFATEENGLSRFDPITQTFKNYHHDPENPNSLASGATYVIREDAQQRYWIGTDSGLNQLDLKTGKMTHHFSGVTIYDLTIEKDGSLLLACSTDEYALIHFFPDTQQSKDFFTNEADPYSLNSSYLMSLLKDHQDNLWIATWGGGINKLVNSYKFEHYYYIFGQEGSLTNNKIYAIYEGKHNQIWISTEGGGLCRFDPVKKEFKCYQYQEDNPNSIISDYTYDIASDSQGNLWIAAADGFSHLDIATETFTNYVNDPENSNSFAGDHSWSIEVDRQDNVWIGTWAGGFYKYDPKNNQFTQYNATRGNEINFILEDHQGMIWLATDNGLDRLNPDTEEMLHYGHNKNNPQTISGNNVTVLYEDQRKRLWVGTSGSGLNLFDAETQTFQHFSRKKEGLASDTVNGIMQDREGDLWLTGNNGLSRFDPDTLKVRNYDVADGLQGDNFNLRSVLASRSGKLYAGGSNGFNSFDLDSLEDNLNVPRVVFTDLKLFNEPVPISKDSILQQHIQFTPEISFDHTENIFSIHFAALDYVTPRKNQYAYQLVGFDKDWVDVASNQRFATYTNLTAGNYQFRVKASNNDGIWNKAGAVIDIEVLPPWWRTKWAYAIYFVVIAWFFIDQQRKLQKSRAYNQKLREIDKLKEQAVQIAQANEQRLRQFLDAIPLGIGILNTDGSMYYMNPTGLQILGFAHKATHHLSNISQTYHFYVAGTHQLYPNEELTGVCALRGESKVLDNIEIQRPDGVKVPIESRGTPIFDDNNQVKYAIITFQDIRERKQAEADRLRLAQEQEAKNAALRYSQEIEAKNKQLIRLNQEKNEFLGIAAHDLKNPLGAISGTAELIREIIDELTKAELLDYAEMIQASSTQMFNLITNLLDVNAIESGKINIQLTQSNLLPIVKRVIGNYKMAAHNKNIQIHFDPTDTEYFAYLDEDITVQVLDNLISNAIKYSPAGKNVYIRIYPTQHGFIRCEVQDEGQGLSAEDLAKLFGKFTRLTPRPTGGEHSTGLGLFIVKKLIEQMQGQVWCESELGKGAIFFVEFSQTPL